MKQLIYLVHGPVQKEKKLQVHRVFDRVLGCAFSME